MELRSVLRTSLGLLQAGKFLVRRFPWGDYRLQADEVITHVLLPLQCRPLYLKLYMQCAE